MELWLLPKYDSLAASGRLRIFQFIPFFEHAGYRVHVSPLLDNHVVSVIFRGMRPRAVDLVRCYWRRIKTVLALKSDCVAVIQYETTPFMPNFLEWWLSFRGVPYIYDYDDAIFHRYDENKNAVIRLLFRKKIANIIRHAAHVLAGSDYLLLYARRFNKNVSLIPTVVDLQRYDKKDFAASVGRTFTIGWIGSPSTTHYLESVLTMLRRFCQEKDAKLVLVGATIPSEMESNIETRPWREDTEVNEIKQFDVGIMPLIDESWARGKCGYKLIQYMACGVPVIASPVGENVRIVEHGVNGYLAATEEEWLNALDALTRDPDLRRRLGEKGREMVEKRYSLQNMAPKLMHLLSEIGPDSEILKTL